MTDLRGYKPEKDVETSSNRSKVIGAAVVVLGLGALGAYAFASQNSPTPANDMVASNQVPTTPRGSQEYMPPPVTDTQPTPTAVPPKAEPTALDNTPLMPSSAGKVNKPADDTSQQAAVKSKSPAATPTPEMAPPENAAPQSPTEPATTPEQPQPQETPAPTENMAPPQGQ